MLKNVFFGILVFTLPTQIASADSNWVDSDGQSCKSVCSAQGSDAVTSGKYEGEDFLVCSGGTSDPRIGFNLIQGWSPKGEKCYSASGTQMVEFTEYACLCETKSTCNVDALTQAIDKRHDLHKQYLKVADQNRFYAEEQRVKAEMRVNAANLEKLKNACE